VTPTSLEFPLSKQRPAHYLFGKLNATEFVQKLAAKGIVDAKVHCFQILTYKILLIFANLFKPVDDHDKSQATTVCVLKMSGSRVGTGLFG
jgi:hypothetical protein